MRVTAPLATPLGRFILIADEVGLCALVLPNESPADEASLEPAGDSHPLLHEAGRQLQAYLQGSLRQFDLPLSIHGTVFQHQVWTQLRAIPYGETLSYGELAERIGGRSKARAVGGAAHANPLAIIIPCHRLIGADGSLTGFGGGLAMKQALLDLERRVIGNQKERAMTIS